MTSQFPAFRAGGPCLVSSFPMGCFNASPVAFFTMFQAFTVSREQAYSGFTLFRGSEVWDITRTSPILLTPKHWDIVDGFAYKFAASPWTTMGSGGQYGAMPEDKGYKAVNKSCS